MKLFFKYYINNSYELKNIDKEYYDNNNIEINYKSDIDESIDIFFKENIFKYLIENNEKDELYLDNLKNYISETCYSYNTEKNKNYEKVISIIEIESFYNNVFDEYLVLSKNCNDDYNEIIDYIDNNFIEELNDEKIINNFKSFIGIMLKYNFTLNIIYIDLKNEYSKKNGFLKEKIIKILMN